jgi:hypothetical protein
MLTLMNSEFDVPATHQFEATRAARRRPLTKQVLGHGVCACSVPADRIARISSAVAAITMSMTPRGAHNGSSIQGGTMLRLRP